MKQRDLEPIDCTIFAQDRSFPDELYSRKRWMIVEACSKVPFAPWGDRNPPTPCRSDECPADYADDDECGCDGRRKWGHEGHYRVGEDAALMFDTSYDIDGLAYIFEKGGDFIFVDIDDVVCPETHTVHQEAVKFLQTAGPTWTEVSISRTGLHAVYRAGEIPFDLSEVTVPLDTKPWGANDDLPAVEIYNNRHVGALTGRTLTDAPLEVREWNTREVRDWLTTRGVTSNNKHRNGTNESADTDSNHGGKVNNNEGSPLNSEIVSDADKVMAAVDALNAQDVAGATIVDEWTDSSGADFRAFLPTWGSKSTDSGTANIVTNDVWKDTGNDPMPGCGYGGPIVMAAIDIGIVSHKNAERGCVKGTDWWKCVGHLRGLGFPIPYCKRDNSGVEAYLQVLSEYVPPSYNPYDDAEACLVAALRACADSDCPASPDDLVPELALRQIAAESQGCTVSDIETDSLEWEQQLFTDMAAERVAAEYGIPKPES